MIFYRVLIQLNDDVDHFEKTITLNVVGNAMPLAEALRDGRFTVSYETEETRIVTVPL